MATSNTTNLGIPIPVPGSLEPFRVAAYNNAVETLDGAVGMRVVTFGTRPGSPFVGELIYQTDTLTAHVYDGSGWPELGGSGGGFETNFLLMGA